MCGIAGVYNLNQSSFSSENLKKMANAIAHRGPDGEGFFVEGEIAFAHRRLAILDLSDLGKQPMISKDGKWVIVFNGCIYNFRELKRELQELGASFVSSTDTEVIVEGIAHFGLDFVHRLNGMFALAIWNREKKELSISRDRFGVKPLYYWFNGKALVFGSEIKAILQHPEFKVAVNPDALNEYFTFQNQFSYHTLFDGVFMLPPANTITIHRNTKEIVHNSWWDYDFSDTDPTLDFESAISETNRLFTQAVKRQMVSDVPVGSYLSGGMDSGSITCIASQEIPRLSTFTCGFDMNSVTGVESNYDERRDAELMASVFKTQHYEMIINAGDPEVVPAQGGPSFGRFAGGHELSQLLHCPVGLQICKGMPAGHGG